MKAKISGQITDQNTGEIYYQGNAVELSKLFRLCLQYPDLRWAMLNAVSKNITDPKIKEALATHIANAEQMIPVSSNREKLTVKSLATNY